MPLYAVNLPNGNTDNVAVFRLLGKLFNQSGVIESAGFTVSAQATPDMTVKVSGSAGSDNAVFINATTGDCYHGWNTANTNVTIGTNSSGSSKTDAVVLYVDTGAGISTPGIVNNPAALKLKTVRGASGTPTDSEINADASISGKPWIRLANVVVGNGVSSINSGNITDTRPKANVGANLVTTASLQANAVTNVSKAGWYSNGGSVTIANNTSGAWPGMSAASFTTSGGVLLCFISMSGLTQQAGTTYLGVTIDGSNTQESGWQSNNNTARFNASGMCVFTNVAAGSHTFVPYGRSNGAGNYTWNDFNSCEITILELKR